MIGELIESITGMFSKNEQTPEVQTVEQAQPEIVEPTVEVPNEVTEETESEVVESEEDTTKEVEEDSEEKEVSEEKPTQE